MPWKEWPCPLLGIDWPLPVSRISGSVWGGDCGLHSCGMDIVAQALQRASEGLVQPGWGSTGELVDLLGMVFPEEGCCTIMLLYNVKI